MRKIVFLVITILLAVTAALSQQTPDEEDVVKITSKLVQMDVIVTDAKGGHVSDLTAADFQIFEDGKPRKITAFSYVPYVTTTSSATSTASPTSTTISPQGRRRSSRPGRVITFVLDDGNCRTSTAGMRAIRESLERFVTRQMQPDDRVAIYQTRAGSSLFQQYTSDKAQLMRAVQRIRWVPAGGGCVTSDGDFFEAAKPATETLPTAQGLQTMTAESPDQQKRRELMEDYNRDRQVVGSLGVLRYVINGLERIPGRKVLFFMSDGVPLLARDRRILPVADLLRDITDRANRSAVVINAIDSRGIFDAEMITSQDDVLIAGDDIQATDRISNERRFDALSSQDGLAFLAHETGGNFFRNQNRLDVPVSRALTLEKGYYLLAYEPDDDAFQGKNFNKIDVRVTRPGLNVISRSGFLGVVDQTNKRPAKTGDSELYEAIVQPLPGAGLNLGLIAYFGNTASGGSFVRSLVHIRGEDITFTDEPDGMKKAVVDVVAVTMNEKNDVVDEFTHAHTFKVPPAALALIEKNGLVYSADVKVRKPGFYNFRVALRDVNSKRIGTASQFVEVPELKPGKLLVSGLVVSEVDAAGKFAVPKAVDPTNAFALSKSGGVPGIRVFPRGSIIAYPYNVYNAKVAAGGKPNLTVEVNVFHDGKILVDGAPQPADLQPQDDWTRISDFGYLRLNPKIPAGDYVLQVIVRDVAGGKNAISTQSSDFQIVD